MTTPSAPSVSVPDELRIDVLEALHLSLKRASVEELGAATPAAVNWRKMQDWLTRSSLTPAGEAISPLPITVFELRNLQTAVDDVVRHRLASHEPDVMNTTERAYRAAMSVPPASLHARTHRSLRHLTISSWVVAIPLGILLIIDVLALVILHSTSRTVMAALAVNLVLVVLASAAWVYHYSRLVHHRRHIHWHVTHG